MHTRHACSPLTCPLSRFGSRSTSETLSRWHARSWWGPGGQSGAPISHTGARSQLAGSPAEQWEALQVKVDDGTGEDVRVEAVEDAAVAWDEGAGVFDASVALEYALDEVAQDGGAAHDGAERGGGER